MKRTQFFYVCAVMLFAGIVMNSCREDELFLPAGENETQSQSQLLKSASTSDYLTNLITEIEALVNDGTLSEGTGQSLIAKIENAIKSIQNGNTNAMKGQLNAFIHQVESLIRNGTLTPEQGEPLISGAKSQIILGEGSFTDSRDGHEYGVVLIGNQLWMAENLAYLPVITPPDLFFLTNIAFYVHSYSGTNIDEARASENFDTYGVLYNWTAALVSCPEGWHLPTSMEWDQLAEFISNDNGGYASYNFTPRVGSTWKIVGRHLKTTSGWEAYWDGTNSCWVNGNGTDDYGFSGLPGGYFDHTNKFVQKGILAWWWSSTENYDTNSWQRNLWNSESIFQLGGTYKADGLSVRCVRN